MLYAPAAWHAQRRNWRAVVQLNLVRSVNAILDILTEEADLLDMQTPISPGGRAHGSLSRTTSITASHINTPALDPSRSTGSMRSMSSATSHNPSLYTPALSHKHQLLRMRLAPLRRVEADLKQILSIDDEATVQPTLVATPFELDGVGYGPSSRRRPQEVMVRSWQAALSPTGEVQMHSARRRSMTVANGPVYTGQSAAETGRPRSSDGHRLDRPIRRNFEGKGRTKDKTRREEIEASEILDVLRDDMKALWEDEAVKSILNRRRVRPEERAGLYDYDCSCFLKSFHISAAF
jgi:guanine nucleotide-binding protein alpha-1 subunit